MVDILGCYENEKDFQKILSYLEVNLPLRRPKRDETGYLIDYDNLKTKYGFSLGVEYANTFENIIETQSFKEKEMVFYIIQDIDRCSSFEEISFPFGISFNLTPNSAVEIFGDYFEYDDFGDCYSWNKDKLVIILNFDEENRVSSISYRLLQDYDLEIINSQKTN